MIVNRRVLKTCFWVLMPAITAGLTSCHCHSALAAPQAVLAQDTAPQPASDAPSVKIEIADESKSIDPTSPMLLEQ